MTTPQLGVRQVCRYNLAVMTANLEPSFSSTLPAPAEGLQAKLWQAVMDSALAAGLDPTKFNSIHREIVGYVSAFLEQVELPAPAPNNHKPPSRLPQIVPRLFGKREERLPASEPAPPIIICGIPGTGKTTFLALLDIALRQTLHLPDAIAPEMSKPNGQTYHIQKRWFNGRPTSLLSVRKWTQLLYFYAWDTEAHRLELAKSSKFIREKLRPMRVIFADEVEMAGYSPTLPDIARQGILVLGSSNQYAFSQLADELIPPRIYRFTGDDMRQGNPGDALVNEGEAAWELFGRVRQRPYHLYGRLYYQLLAHSSSLYALLNFHEAVNAPLLESEWLHFCQTAYRQTGLESQPPLTLLFERFSLETLSSDYNAIIRFITLFDAIEQLGVGVLIQNEGEGLELSRVALAQMKAAVENAPDVPAEIKAHTVVGIDRATSRIGQAAVRARHFME